MEHSLIFGTGYDEGENIIPLLPTVVGLLRFETTDVSDVSYEWDYVFDLVFDSKENLIMFRMKHL